MKEISQKTRMPNSSRWRPPGKFFLRVLDSGNIFFSLVLLLSGISFVSPVLSADECGPENTSNPSDTVTCSAGSYDNGISYTNSDGLTVLLDDPSIDIVPTVPANGVSLNSSLELGAGENLVIDAAQFNEIRLNSAIGSRRAVAVSINNINSEADAIAIAGSPDGTNNWTISTNGRRNAQGVFAQNLGSGDAIVRLYGGTIEMPVSTASGSFTREGAVAIARNSGDALIESNGTDITTRDQLSPALYAWTDENNTTGTARVTMNGGNVRTEGNNSLAALFANVRNETSNSDDTLAEVIVTGDAQIETTSTNVNAILAQNEGSGDAIVRLEDGDVIAAGFGLVAFSERGGGASVFVEEDSTVEANIFGIYAESSGDSDAEVRTSGEVRAGDDGIVILSEGAGNSVVEVNGLVESRSRAALRFGAIGTTTGSGSVDVVVSETGSLSGFRDGISGRHLGDGDVTITTVGDVSSQIRDGMDIDSRNSDIKINAGNVSGGGWGIIARTGNGFSVDMEIDGDIEGSQVATGFLRGGISIGGGSDADSQHRIRLKDGATVRTGSPEIFASIQNRQGGSSLELISETGSTIFGQVIMGDGDDIVEFNGGDFTQVTNLFMDSQTATKDNDIDILKFTGSSGVFDDGILRDAEFIEISDGSTISILDGTLDFLEADQTGKLRLLTDGAITTQEGTAGDILTIDGDVEGAGGAWLLDAVLDDDASDADLMVVTGETSGTTRLNINKVGGEGAQTIVGIRVVDAQPGASGGEFILDNPDYVIEATGEDALIAGVYGYALRRGDDLGRGTSDDWYLQSELDNNLIIFQPATPGYETLPAALLGLLEVDTLEQRVGNRQWILASDPDAQHSGLWFRGNGKHSDMEPAFTTTETNYELNSWKLQAGLDMLLSKSDSGDLVGGLNISTGDATLDASSDRAGQTSTKVDGLGLGATLTWFGAEGFYIDGQANFQMFEADLSSQTLGALTNDLDGSGTALSLEMGKRVAISPDYSLVPQAQLVWSDVNFDSFMGPNGERVSADDTQRLELRLGLAAESEFEVGEGDRGSLYGIFNLIHGFSDQTAVLVNDVPLATANSEWTAEVGLGGTYDFNDGQGSLHGEISLSEGLGRTGDFRAAATAGIRWQW